MSGLFEEIAEKRIAQAALQEPFPEIIQERKPEEQQCQQLTIREAIK